MNILLKHQRARVCFLACIFTLLSGFFLLAVNANNEFSTAKELAPSERGATTVKSSYSVFNWPKIVWPNTLLDTKNSNSEESIKMATEQSEYSLPIIITTMTNKLTFPSFSLHHDQA